MDIELFICQVSSWDAFPIPVHSEDGREDELPTVAGCATY